ncbi:MAG TPA: flagellar motor protein MotB [Candidatus Omnitrophota bacterium]|nr:flagellar motor protein MotB [Candidatus Omnitrophota bacterium]HRZ15439.1 flagellar motor protein MotB [Candidatus Omnitrophota bacterium]
MPKHIVKYAVIVLISFFSAGCMVYFQGGRRSDVEKIDELSQRVDELSQAKRILEERLSGEIKDQTVKLNMMDKGLVITFVADIMFDSGKAALRQEAYSSLDKVARVLNENVPDLNIGIEGHTDNQPITVSGWKSNWELSVARALSVLHYLQDERKVSAQRLTAIGHGEHVPVADNGSREGRQLNRRVEIVIMPKLPKVKEGAIAPKKSEGSAYYK